MRKPAAALLALTGRTLAVAAPADAEPENPAGFDDLALTPPMGFSIWNSTFYGPQFNEELMRAMADLVVSTGLKNADYDYINIDDCWSVPQNSPTGSRDADGHTVPTHGTAIFRVRVVPTRPASTAPCD